MQAAIQALRRELSALDEMCVASKGELAMASSGSENETAVIVAARNLMREREEVVEAIRFLTWAEEQAATRRGA